MRLTCPQGCGENGVDCCGRTLLKNQPDFKAQKIWLEEVVNDKHHDLIFFPKFHCEFNFIEMFWCESKRETRLQCDYTWEGLKKTVPKVMNEISVIKIRRFARKCERYMDCYHKGLSPKLAEYACKKYRSHRCIPSDIVFADLEREMKERSK